jgi:adenylate cyclase
MSGERVERRLAAILAADVAGYSRLMGVDEEGTLRRLQEHRRELVDPKIREHHGRIVKTTGDGMLVEFGSVVDAVRCAVEVQRGMVDRDTEFDHTRRIFFRIGINLGDIIVEGDDIFGDGVNIAARLEALAEPGGVCISGAVIDQIGDRLGFVFQNMGEQSVKNISRPVRTYGMSSAEVAGTPPVAVKALDSAAARRRRQGRSERGPRKPELKAPPRLSVLVLSFANLSADPEQDHFAEAITDDVISGLSRIEGYLVISRSTAFTYKGKAVDVKQIGRDLGVRYVLAGSVRRRGGRLQLSAELTDTESGAVVWVDTGSMWTTAISQWLSTRSRRAWRARCKSKSCRLPLAASSRKVRRRPMPAISRCGAGPAYIEPEPPKLLRRGRNISSGRCYWTQNPLMHGSGLRPFSPNLSATPV